MKKIFVRMQSTAQLKFCFIFTCFNKSLLETGTGNKQLDCINDRYTYVYGNNQDTFWLMSETYKTFASF